MTSATDSASAYSHWMPGVERRGLGALVLGLNHISLVVADVGRSVSFYTDVLGLQQIHRPNVDRHGAWLTIGNVELHLIKGTPLVHTGDNLIVCHWALDVSDPDLAFQRLREMQVPFEINVSVPKGAKVESEAGGGSRQDTLGQAFLRDPDGYYIELCNCHILTDFALGRSSGMVDQLGQEIFCGVYQSTKPVSLFCMSKLVALASRAKKRCQERSRCYRCLEVAKLKRQASQSSCTSSSGGGEAELRHNNVPGANILVLEDDTEEEVFVDEHILSNFMARRRVYGDICQSFGHYELQEFLAWSNNDAPTAILLMIDEIYKGRKRIFQPPAYYVEGSHSLKDDDDLTEETTDRSEDPCILERSDSTSQEMRFRPQPFEPPKRLKPAKLSILTAGLRSLKLDERESEHRRHSIYSESLHDSHLRFFASLTSLNWSSDEDTASDTNSSFHGDEDSKHG